ncbi:hypothetical protein [Rhizobium sp. PL01]|uniref:hypothetical protein n=1 Tax=Rhizobium sp. PL01 TaxID=3085631 RepID=UPI002980D703|nr:hypothetical protein [Rhizobium sp. PL01]MDW5314493.1 hypothetical protein [Rhizobium sp. PL01]
MFIPKDCFHPTEVLPTDLWAEFGIPEVLLVDNSGGFIRAMFADGDVSLETNLRPIDDGEEAASW